MPRVSRYCGWEYSGSGTRFLPVSSRSHRWARPRPPQRHHLLHDSTTSSTQHQRGQHSPSEGRSVHPRMACRLEEGKTASSRHDAGSQHAEGGWQFPRHQRLHKATGRLEASHPRGAEKTQLRPPANSDTPWTHPTLTDHQVAITLGKDGDSATFQAKGRDFSRALWRSSTGIVVADTQGMGFMDTGEAATYHIPQGSLKDATEVEVDLHAGHRN